MTDKLEKCRCGCTPVYRRMEPALPIRLDCPCCPASTPWCDSIEEADDAWNRMQSAETFTKADMVNFGNFCLAVHGCECPADEDHVDAFLAQRRKP